MKKVTLLSTILAATLCAVVAQEATDLDLREKRDQTPAPVQQISPTPNVPEISKIDEIFKQTSLGKEADERRLHIEWRDLANRVANDPEVVAARKSADSTHTDLEKRDRLRLYYDVYYGKMRTLASSETMKRALDAVKQEHLSYINQPRVRHETDAALPTPSPSPRRHHK